MLLAGERASATLGSNEDVLLLAKVFLAPACRLLLSHVAGSMSAMSRKGEMSVGVVLTQATRNL